MKFISIILVFVLFAVCILCLSITAQDNLYTSYTTVAGREKLYHNLVENSINKSLKKPLNDSTEQDWEQAFAALELLQYKNSWVQSRISYAFDSIKNKNIDFERALMEVAYTNYAGIYFTQVFNLLQQTNDTKIFAMCAEYILLENQDGATLDNLEEIIIKKFSFQNDDPVIAMLSEHILEIKFPSQPIIQHKNFTDLLNKKFLPGQIIMYSFQRKNRNYPGIVLVRNAMGKFIRDSADNIFYVPQLARSITNLPGYLTNGNTPQGIYKMHGFNVSRSNFIGPSPNIQLSLPAEMTPQQFFNDSTIADSVWSKALYDSLLPISLKQYFPLYNSLYAGLAGRTEIIAHGTTINPEYYKNEIYYPHTPSQGCLCTKELWNGKRLESNQQKLVNALLKAGGAEGYCVVVELDDKQKPVALEEILPFISKAESFK